MGKQMEIIGAHDHFEVLEVDDKLLVTESLLADTGTNGALSDAGADGVPLEDGVGELLS